MNQDNLQRIETEVELLTIDAPSNLAMLFCIISMNSDDAGMVDALSHIGMHLSALYRIIQEEKDTSQVTE